MRRINTYLIAALCLAISTGIGADPSVASASLAAVISHSGHPKLRVLPGSQGLATTPRYETILCSGYHRWADIKPSDYPVHMFRESDVRALVYRIREPLHRKRLAQKGVYLESIFSTLHGSGACASYYINERFHLSEAQVHKLISFGSSDMVRFSKSQGQLLKSK